jgi:hypothetical protein
MVPIEHGEIGIELEIERPGETVSGIVAERVFLTRKRPSSGSSQLERRSSPAAAALAREVIGCRVLPRVSGRVVMGGLGRRRGIVVAADLDPDDATRHGLPAGIRSFAPVGRS